MNALESSLGGQDVNSNELHYSQGETETPLVRWSDLSGVPAAGRGRPRTPIEAYSFRPDLRWWLKALHGHPQGNPLDLEALSAWGLGFPLPVVDGEGTVGEVRTCKVTGRGPGALIGAQRGHICDPRSMRVSTAPYLL